MRRAARIDGNQKEIVKALRKVGATVQSLAAIGKGCPDLLVAFRGKTFLLEVKDPTKPIRDQRLTPDQVKWHQGWADAVYVVKSIQDALLAIRAVNAE